MRILARSVVLATLFTFLLASAGGPQSDELVPGPGQGLSTAQGQSATLLPNGRWLIIGGQGPSGPVGAAYIWDTGSGQTTILPGQLDHPRAWHTATLLPDSTVLIIGGVGADGQVVAVAELFDSGAQTFAPLVNPGPTPRAYHTATLLTDGQVLITGGASATGEVLADAEMWNFSTQVVEPMPGTLTTPRLRGQATLLSDGRVLLWGGFDANGLPLGSGDLYDPEQQSFVAGLEVPLNPDDHGILPQLEASLPVSGAANVSLQPLIALRFSKPLRVDTLTVNTVALAGPGGVEPVTVVPADEGRLLFVTPVVMLQPGARYTLTVNGAADAAGYSLSRSRSSSS